MSGNFLRRDAFSLLHRPGEVYKSPFTERGRSSGVEHNLAKVRVVSSNLIARSNDQRAPSGALSFLIALQTQRICQRPLRAAGHLQPTLTWGPGRRDRLVSGKGDPGFPYPFCRAASRVVNGHSLRFSNDAHAARPQFATIRPSTGIPAFTHWRKSTSLINSFCVPEWKRSRREGKGEHKYGIMMSLS